MHLQRRDEYDDYYYYYGENSCAASGSFTGATDLGWNAGGLAVDGFGLLVSISLAITYVVVLITRRGTSKIAPWWIAALAVVFGILSFIIRLIGDVLYDCNMIRLSTYYSLWTAMFLLFYTLANIMWLGIFMIPLTRSLAKEASVKSMLITSLQSAWFAIVAIIWIAHHIVAFVLTWAREDDDSSVETYRSLRKAYPGLVGAANTLYLVAAIETSGLLIWLLIKSKRAGTTQNKTAAVCVAIGFIMANAILGMFEGFHYVVYDHYWTWEASLATGILEIVFLYGAAKAIIITAAKDATSRSRRNVQNPPYYHQSAPYPPAYQYEPAQKVQTEYNSGGNVQPGQYPYSPGQYPPAQQNAHYVPPSEMGVSPSELGGHARHQAP